MGGCIFLGLADCLKEIESTMMNAVNEGRELSGEEVIHILKVQAEEIKRQIQDDDGLSDEEALAEHFSNNRLDYFKDRDRMRN